MMKAGITFAAIFGLAAAASVHVQETRTALESDVEISRFSVGWDKEARADPATELTLTFAVKQQNLDQLRETLIRVSDPKNFPETYGHHLTKEEVDTLVAPKTEAVDAVRTFLQSHGVMDCVETANADVIRCAVTVAVAERMLDTEYYTYRHTKRDATVVRAAERHYSVPESLSRHIDLVSPTVRFPTFRAQDSLPSASLRTNTPATLRALYKVGDVEGTSKDNKQACTAFLEQHYKQSDLDSFWKKYYPKGEGRKIKVIGPDTGFPGIEASLDIEYISSMGGGVETEFWSFKGNAPDNKENEPFLTWVFLIGNTSDADVPKASGDSGVAPDSGECKNGRFAGQWPAGSPWVTGVGGTENGDVGVPEVCWGGSSGGFSDRWSRPDFQRDAVETYLKTATLPDASHFNASSRGFPDVAAQATDFLVINGGFTQGVAGTSCASPTFTGIFSLLNDLRLAAGKSTLGWANPFFYQNADMFQDIVTGSNGAGIGCGGKGFEAIKGWDPVTGLGTPDYEKMAKVVKALP